MKISKELKANDDLSPRLLPLLLHPNESPATCTNKEVHANPSSTSATICFISFYLTVFLSLLKYNRTIRCIGGKLCLMWFLSSAWLHSEDITQLPQTQAGESITNFLHWPLTVKTIIRCLSNVKCLKHYLCCSHCNIDPEVRECKSLCVTINNVYSSIVYNVYFPFVRRFIHRSRLQSMKSKEEF